LSVSENKEILTLTKSFHIKDEHHEKLYEFRDVNDVDKFWEEFKLYCIGPEGSDNFILGGKEEKKISKFKEDLFKKVPELKQRWSDMVNISNQKVFLIYI
jgi:hypothetical protein